jgi:uncharacterized protein
MSDPVSLESRIKIIDILRGFALLGIAMVHFTEQYYAGQAPEIHANLTAKTLADQIVMGFIGIFIQGKFYMIFSFLFGLSFFIQSEKSADTGSFILRFTWRLLILFAIGLLHHLHYRGDILTIYAALGVLLILLYKLPDRALLIVGLMLILNLPGFSLRLYEGIRNVSGGFTSDDQASLLAYYDTLKTGSYFSILAANWKELIPKFEFQVLSGRIYITTGLFLLGLYAGRKKFFESWMDGIPFIQKLRKTAWWILAGCIVFVLVILGVTQVLHLELNQSLQFAMGGLAYDVFNACLATIYVTSILLLYRKEKWRHRLMRFYAVGRMGLTTYLVQSVFGVLIFFSVGLGWLNESGVVICLLIGLAVYVLQIYGSEWWMKRFRYGFFAWLWRSLTYLKWQEFRRSS